MATKATHTHFTSDKGHSYTHSYTRRPAEPGGSAYGVGVAGRSLSGVARGQLALLEADDAVGDVRSVRALGEEREPWSIFLAHCSNRPSKWVRWRDARFSGNAAVFHLVNLHLVA